MHTVPEEPEETEEPPEETEAALVAGVRRGDVDAALVLWRRHSCRARAWAGRHVDGPGEADRAVRTAFARVLAEIASEEDPTVPFLLYLCLTIEHELGALPGERMGDHPLVLAFRRLRRSYQTLLWHTAVEPLHASGLAAVLDHEEADLPVMSRHAVGLLRSEWVAEVVSDPSVGDSCVWVLLRLDASQAGILGDLSAQRYGRHLLGCAWCRSMVADLGDPTEALRRLLL